MTSRILTSVTALIAVAASLGACADAKRGAAHSPTPTTPSRAAATTGCGGLRISDIARVAPELGAVAPRPLAPAEPHSCGGTFIDGSGSLAVSITQQSGDARVLRSARSSARAQARAGKLRSVPELGPGAFLAGNRILGFRHGRQVVILQTGYGAGNGLLLSPQRMIRLGKILASR